MKHSLWFLILTACGGVVLPESSESSGPDVTTDTAATTDTETEIETTTSTNTPAPVCSPEDIFQGSDGCYVPDELCCPGVGQLDQPLDMQCSAQTEGAMPAAFVCNPAPEPGPATDGLGCLAFKTVVCQGAEHVVLCCQD
jgi:hypothetical protein